jgi:hypothetical protein
MVLGGNDQPFGSKRLPLGAIYVLATREASLTSPVVEEVSGGDTLLTLVANSYMNYLLDRDMRRWEFEVLSRVVSRIPIRRVRPPAEPSALFALCEAIAADARRVIAPVSADATSVYG